MILVPAPARVPRWLPRPHVSDLGDPLGHLGQLRPQSPQLLVVHRFLVFLVVVTMTITIMVFMVFVFMVLVVLSASAGSAPQGTPRTRQATLPRPRRRHPAGFSLQATDDPDAALNRLGQEGHPEDIVEGGAGLRV